MKRAIAMFLVLIATTSTSYLTTPPLDDLTCWGILLNLLFSEVGGILVALLLIHIFKTGSDDPSPGFYNSILIGIAPSMGWFLGLFSASFFAGFNPTTIIIYIILIIATSFPFIWWVPSKK